MPWRDVLVFTDGSMNGLARMQMAAIAALSAPDAFLTAVVPVLLPPTPTSGLAGGLRSVVETARDVAREDAGQVVVAVRTVAPTLGERLAIEAPELEIVQVSRWAGNRGRLSDVIVVAQPIAADASALDDAMLDGALFRSRRPVLVVPRWETVRRLGERVLIA